MRTLLDRPAWIFDMDGTLTVAAHDFDAIRAELGLAPRHPILEQLAAIGEPRRAQLETRLAELELEIARASRPARGALDLLERLAGRARLGILTRNTRANAIETLAAAGLAGFFPEGAIVGRDEAPPKPDPGGVLALLGQWRLAPEDAVVIGDYRFDLEAGRTAGTAVVYCDPSGGFEFAELADLCVRSLSELVLAVDPEPA